VPWRTQVRRLPSPPVTQQLVGVLVVAEGEVLGEWDYGGVSENNHFIYKFRSETPVFKNRI